MGPRPTDLRPGEIVVREDLLREIELRLVDHEKLGKQLRHLLALARNSAHEQCAAIEPTPPRTGRKSKCVELGKLKRKSSCYECPLEYFGQSGSFPQIILDRGFHGGKLARDRGKIVKACELQKVAEMTHESRTMDPATKRKAPDSFYLRMIEAARVGLGKKLMAAMIP